MAYGLLVMIIVSTLVVALFEIPGLLKEKKTKK